MYVAPLVKYVLCSGLTKPSQIITTKIPTLHTYILTYTRCMYLKGDLCEVALFQCKLGICSLREMDHCGVEYGVVERQVGLVPIHYVVANPLPTGQEAHVEEGVASVVAVRARDTVAEVLVHDLAARGGVCYVGDEDVQILGYLSHHLACGGALIWRCCRENRILSGYFQDTVRILSGYYTVRILYYSYFQDTVRIQGIARVLLVYYQDIVSILWYCYLLQAALSRGIS